MQYQLTKIEHIDYPGQISVNPVVTLTSCERTEKERIIRLDAYSLSITFDIPDTLDSEMNLYLYGTAVRKAVEQNPTLYGVADRAVMTEKKYIFPKHKNCGQNWQLVLTLRVTVEEMGK